MVNADREVKTVCTDAQAVSLGCTSIVVGTSSKAVVVGCAPCQPLSPLHSALAT